MKKETLIEIILGTVGGLVFAQGMTMCLLPEWKLMGPGVVTALIGFVILLSIFIVRSSYSKKEHRSFSWGMILSWLIGIGGALIMGFGMSRIMIEEVSRMEMIAGIATGMIGLMVCVLDYPIYSYLRKRNG